MNVFRSLTKEQNHLQFICSHNRIKTLISEANLTGRVFPISYFYPAWETDEIIANELYRNIGLAIICVSVTTLLLLRNLITSGLVILCVLLSLVDVAGFMHFCILVHDPWHCHTRGEPTHQPVWPIDRTWSPTRPQRANLTGWRSGLPRLSGF